MHDANYNVYIQQMAVYVVERIDILQFLMCFKFRSLFECEFVCISPSPTDTITLVDPPTSFLTIRTLGSVGYISMFIEPTITRVPSAFSGYIWFDTKIVFWTNQPSGKMTKYLPLYEQLQSLTSNTVVWNNRKQLAARNKVSALMLHHVRAPTSLSNGLIHSAIFVGVWATMRAFSNTDAGIHPWVSARQ